MPQHFNLVINGVLNDDNILETHLDANIQCQEKVAIALLTSILRKNEDLKELFYKALIADNVSTEEETDVEL